MRAATAVVRPWDLPLTGDPAGGVLEHGIHAAVVPAFDSAGVPAFLGGYAERTTSTTPGAEPPRDPLS
jgi:hypothetical protein